MLQIYININLKIQKNKKKLKNRLFELKITSGLRLIKIRKKKSQAFCLLTKSKLDINKIKKMLKSDKESKKL
jgi:hypothetical protein